MTLKFVAFLLPTILLSQQVRAQGYYLNRVVQRSDSSINQALKRLSLPTAIPDVRSNGMGLTRIADENSTSSLLYNPGFLGRSDKVAGIGSVIAIAPYQTIDAVVFVSGNSADLEGAFSLRALQEAVEEYRNGIGFQQQVEDKLANVYAFTKELFEKVVGNPDAPDIHGALFDVDAHMQIGHWGFGLSGYGQSGMAAYPGPILAELLDIYLRTDFDDSTQSDEALVKLEALMDEIIDPVTGLVSPGALPGFYSLTYTDIIATAGYGLTLAESLSVGATAKIVNRRFSAARISANDAGDLTQKLYGDLRTGVTGLTFDIGGVYRPSSNLTIGMNLQNLIPLAVLSSDYTLNFSSLWVQQDRDSAGNPITNTDGDTALVASAQNVTMTGPSRLVLPLVANIGALFSIHKDWDVSFELADIGQQVSTYENYAQRFGFGMEYRLHFFEDNFHVAPRVGFANAEPTWGLGISYRNFMLNAAYYTSSIVRARKNIAAQVSIGW